MKFWNCKSIKNYFFFLLVHAYGKQCDENNKDYLGIVTLVEPEINPTRKEKLKHSFSLGNGIKEDDPIEAAK